MSRKSISPMNLLKKMTDSEWLNKMAVRRGSVSIINIYHDDGCPSEHGESGLLSCTCHVVDYEFSHGEVLK